MTQTNTVDRPLCALAALAAWLGIALQLWVSAHLAQANGQSFAHGVVQALQYFTVLTNILVALAATRIALSDDAQGFFTRPATVAAVALYILVVGIIYSLFLRSLWAPKGVAWVADELLHDVTPLLFVAWWIAYAPKAGLTWVHPLKWLAYPLAYYGFVLLVGAHTGRYLYHFADVTELGYAIVARNGLLLLLLFWVLGMATVARARLHPAAR